MRRMAMGRYMAGIRSFSTGWRLPQLDRIALGIVDAGEAPGRGIVPFRLGDHLDAGIAELRQQLVDPVDPQVEHPLALGREMIGVGWKGREDGGAGLLLPHAPVAASDAEMLAIPLPKRFRIARAKEESAYSSDRHVVSP